MTCPKCQKPMENLGNISGTINASHPPSWLETYVCHVCKVKETVLVRGHTFPKPPDVSGYEFWNPGSEPDLDYQKDTVSGCTINTPAPGTSVEDKPTSSGGDLAVRTYLRDRGMSTDEIDKIFADLTRKGAFAALPRRWRWEIVSPFRHVLRDQKHESILEPGFIRSGEDKYLIEKAPELLDNLRDLLKLPMRNLTTEQKVRLDRISDFAKGFK